MLAVSETHLSNIDNDDELNIPNYSFLRKYRQGCKNHWGGVLIYYQSSIPSHEVGFNFETGITETIWLEIDFRAEKLLLGCVYRPPNDKHFLKNFESVINKIVYRKNVLIRGDLNIDLLKHSTMQTSLRRLICIFKLYKCCFLRMQLELLLLAGL